MTIGIPKALFYWKKPFATGVDGGHFWENFFGSLGVEVVLSPETNKEIIEKGVKTADPETCFSNKVFWGHLLWLDGKCDLIFVPRLKTKKEFGEVLEYCPKFFGLPDLAKILVKTPILTESFDEKKEKFGKSLKKLGKKLGFKEKEIRKATEFAFSREKEVQKRQKEDFFKKIKSEKQKIVLISHPYNLYDEFVNLRIEKKLKNLGAEVIFIDEISIEQRTANNEQHTIDYPKFHWEFGKEIMEKIQEILKYGVAGAIEISSFLCGCDAVLKEFVEKISKERKIPFLYLIIDEHTADAGIQTRLEAFMDTLSSF